MVAMYPQRTTMISTMTKYDLPPAHVAATEDTLKHFADEAQSQVTRYDNGGEIWRDSGKTPDVVGYLDNVTSVRRKQIAKEVGTGISTLTSILNNLKDAGLVQDGEKVSSGNAGRPTVLVRPTNELHAEVHKNPHWEEAALATEIARHFEIDLTAARLAAVRFMLYMLDEAVNYNDGNSTEEGVITDEVTSSDSSAAEYDD